MELAFIAVMLVARARVRVRRNFRWTIVVGWFGMEGCWRVVGLYCSIAMMGIFEMMLRGEVYGVMAVFIGSVRCADHLQLGKSSMRWVGRMMENGVLLGEIRYGA